VLRKLAGVLDWVPGLATRLIVGLLFVPTGWGKLQNLDKVREYFTGELHLPPFMAPVIATTELVVGILLVLGLSTRVAAGAVIVLMIGALKSAILPAIDGWDKVHGLGTILSSMFWGSEIKVEGVDDPIVLQDALHKAGEFWYLVVAAWLATFGGGRFSLDHLLNRFWLKDDSTR